MPNTHLPGQLRHWNWRRTWPALAVPVLLVAYVLIHPFAARVVFDFRAVDDWQVRGGATAARRTPDGILVEADTPAYLLSPARPDQQAPLRGLRWQDTPYVKVELTPAPQARTLTLAWVPDSEKPQVYKLPVRVAAMASTVLVDTQSDQPWVRRTAWDERFPGQGRIHRFGLLLDVDAEIRCITLLSMPGLRDLARVVWDEYWTIEPVKVSSINFQYGLEVLGVPLSTALGVVTGLLGLLVLLRSRRGTVLLLFWGSLACFVVFDVTLDHTLWEQARQSAAISAWHADRFDEYASRFGEEFARLDRVLTEHVPRGTAVAFPDPVPHPVQGEVNWIWFLYFGEYDNARDRFGNDARIGEEAKYVFYYHPRKLVHDPGRGTLRHRDTNATHRVRVVGQVSDRAKLLEVIRD